MLEGLPQGEQLLTTNHVVGESWIVMLRRGNHRRAVGLLDHLKERRAAGAVVVEQVTAEQEEAAWEWLRRHDEREYSFVDATSFRVMRDRRIREALAFDSDFAAAGFVEVVPPA